MNEGQSFWIMEYQNVSNQFVKFLDIYIKTFMIYIGIMGLIFKFALDVNSTPELRRTLIKFGILCSILFFLCIYYAENMTKQLRRRRKTALKQLGQNTEDEFIGGHWASIVFLTFNLFVVIGLYILYQ
jgi:hypothetical protein